MKEWEGGGEKEWWMRNLGRNTNIGGKGRGGTNREVKGRKRQ